MLAAIQTERHLQSIAQQVCNPHSINHKDSSIQDLQHHPTEYYLEEPKLNSDYSSLTGNNILPNITSGAR
jgi:hypothetical protein